MLAAQWQGVVAGQNGDGRAETQKVCKANFDIDKQWVHKEDTTQRNRL